MRRDVTLGDLAARGVFLQLVPDALDRHGAYEPLTIAARRAIGVAIARPTKFSNRSNSNKRNR